MTQESHSDMTVSVTLAEGEDSGGQLCCTSPGVTQEPHSDMTVSVTLAAGEGSGLRRCRICRPLFSVVPFLSQSCDLFLFLKLELS